MEGVWMTALHVAPHLPLPPPPVWSSVSGSAVKEKPPSLSLLKRKAGAAGGERREGGGGDPGRPAALRRVDSAKEQVREDVNVRRFKF